MNTVDTDLFENAYLAQWLKTTHHYLLGDQKRVVNATETALLDSKSDSHGAQDRFLSRARGSLLRLVKRTAQHDQNPLQELERAFYFQVSFIAQHPDIPKRLLGWLSQNGDSRIRRRIQKVIDQYESRLCRMIDRAKHQGLIRADIEPRTAASVLISMIQGVALKMDADFRQRELMLREAFEGFAMYRAGMAFASK
jgi:hypothetical protein